MDKQRLPRIYHERNKERTVDALVEAEAKAEKSEPAELVEHTPAASSKQDNYTLLKFYRVSQTLLQTVIQVMGALIGSAAKESCCYGLAAIC
jgi:hypothetical protein